MKDEKVDSVQRKQGVNEERDRDRLVLRCENGMSQNNLRRCHYKRVIVGIIVVKNNITSR
jgi:hypothetical protein